MSTHTPGPWAFTKSIDSDGDVCFDISQETGAEYTTHLSDVAYSRLFKTYVSEHAEIQESNARLIAAAPELLAACKKFMEYQTLDISDDLKMMLLYADAVQLTTKAISKATGASA